MSEGFNKALKIFNMKKKFANCVINMCSKFGLINDNIEAVKRKKQIWEDYKSENENKEKLYNEYKTAYKFAKKILKSLLDEVDESFENMWLQYKINCASRQAHATIQGLNAYLRGNAKGIGNIESFIQQVNLIYNRLIKNKTNDHNQVNLFTLYDRFFEIYKISTKEAKSLVTGSTDLEVEKKTEKNTKKDKTRKKNNKNKEEKKNLSLNQNKYKSPGQAPHPSDWDMNELEKNHPDTQKFLKSNQKVREWWMSKLNKSELLNNITKVLILTTYNNIEMFKKRKKNPLESLRKFMIKIINMLYPNLEYELTNFVKPICSLVSCAKKLYSGYSLKQIQNLLDIFDVDGELKTKLNNYKKEKSIKDIPSPPEKTTCSRYISWLNSKETQGLEQSILKLQSAKEISRNLYDAINYTLINHDQKLKYCSDLAKNLKNALDTLQRKLNDFPVWTRSASVQKWLPHPLTGKFGLSNLLKRTTLLKDSKDILIRVAFMIEKAKLKTHVDEQNKRITEIEPDQREDILLYFNKLKYLTDKFDGMAGDPYAE